MATIKIIEAGGTNPDGVQIGQTGEKLGFLGATPIVQRASAAGAAVATTASTNSSPYGFSEAQANGIITLLNEVRATLVAFGLHKGSA